MYKKIKILYAADNRYGSLHQLQRFLLATNNKNYEIKVAAFENSMGNLDVDYTLDCLLNFSSHNSETISYNGNYKYYFNEIKRFNPDLIITDYEIYTALIAIELNIRYWQCSPMLLQYVLDNQIIYSYGWKKKYETIFIKDSKRKIYEESAIIGADKKIVVSDLCDLKNKMTLPTNYIWARPDFILKNNTNKKYTVSNGLSYPLFDAFYNQQYSLIKPNYSNYESIIQSFIHQEFELGEITNHDHLSKYKSIDICVNDRVKFFHEYIKEI